jgi:hypothetical protein
MVRWPLVQVAQSICIIRLTAVLPGTSFSRLMAVRFSLMLLGVLFQAVYQPHRWPSLAVFLELCSPAEQVPYLALLLERWLLSFCQLRKRDLSWH